MENQKLDFLDRVVKIAKVKYELDEDIVLGLEKQLNYCYENRFSPIKTVEYIAELIF